MIGFYDYTVILTYCSLLSASIGVFVSLSGEGHPYIGVMLLMFCGLCDTFDGKVARSKKNRTKKEKDFGVQIDSLSDLVAFGVLPACIGMALYKREIFECHVLKLPPSVLSYFPVAVVMIIGALFVLCALIRLAYFNITVEETQADWLGDNKYYRGLPVTSTALIFPTFLIVRHFLSFNLSYIYFLILIIVGILFVLKFNIKKPNSNGINIMLAIGAVEFLIVLILKIVSKVPWIK